MLVSRRLCASQADARDALALDPTYVKAYYRRGEAHFALARYKEARTDFKKVLQLRPNDKDAKAKHKECDKEYRRVMFERAIESEHTKSAFETVDIDAMTVDASYTGPRLPDGPGDVITADFVVSMMGWFREQKTIHIKYLWKILRGCAALFKSLPTLVDVPLDATNPNAQITVCGDTHGQFYDVLRLFELNGIPSPTNPYLFNGDFVDRGSFSAEVVITFLAFKLLYPTSFFMSRGNHETVAMNRMYGFEGEVRHKYDSRVMDAFTEVFNVLPLAHVVGGKVFVVHGGLFSKEGVTLDELRKLPRAGQPPGKQYFPMQQTGFPLLLLCVFWFLKFTVLCACVRGGVDVRHAVVRPASAHGTRSKQARCRVVVWSRRHQIFSRLQQLAAARALA